MESSQNPFVPFCPSFSFRFRLRSLLLVTAAIGVLIAPVHWFGAPYFISMLLSVGLIAACAATYRNSEPIAAVCVAVVGIAVGFLFILASVVFFFHAVVNAAACLVLVIFRPRVSVFAAGLMLPAIGIYGMSLWEGYERQQRFAQWRAEFPLVSLDERLQFDRQNANLTSDKTAPLSRDVTTRLNEQDEWYQQHYYGRAWGLEELHERSYEHFARAAGFGFARMPALYRELVEQKPHQPLTLPRPVPDLQVEAAALDLGNTHAHTVFNFADQNRLGYVRSRDAVAGFESHQVSDDAYQRGCRKQVAHWQVARIELVSLLRHDEPRVYNTEVMPPMNALADVPTRSLNAFEEAALPKLATQQDTVIEREPERILMVGAVRAGARCLECHDGSRGRLLGAFSYEIVPRKSPAPPKKEAAAPEALTAQLK